MTHIGIELRISCRAGDLLVADSDRLHRIAVLGGSSRWHDFSCLPDCRLHGWYEVIRNPGLVIEIRPVMLAEPPDDDDDCQAGNGASLVPSPCQCSCSACSGCLG